MLPPIHRWEHAGRPLALVHVVHGMAEHGARYERFARALTSAGFHVWAHDHRGHGVNPAPGLQGHFADTGGWRLVLEDAGNVSREMASALPGVPLFLFAHSMGSFAAQALIAEHGTPYAGVVLSGTDGPPGAHEAGARALARIERAVKGPRAPGTWLRKAVFGRYNRRFAPTRTDFDWLSRDPVEVDAYRHDPRCGFALTTQAWVDFLEGKAHLCSASHLQQVPRDLPVHVISGTRDPVGDDGAGVRRLARAYAAAGLMRMTERLYPGARHELVNETNRDEVTKDVIAWIDGVIAAGAAPGHGPT